MMSIKSFTALLSLLSIQGAVAQLPADMNSRGIEYPSFRFLEWRWLEADVQTIANGLGYSQETWDWPGNEPIEAIGFEGLGLAQSAVESLGFTEDTWDCFINHYLYYEWSQLDPELQGYALEIGWTEATWGDTEKPDTYTKFWDELTDEQRGNATELCYFEGIWNNEMLKAFATGPPTDPPTQPPSISASPTKAPTASPTITLTEMPTAAKSASTSSTVSVVIISAMSSIALSLLY